VEGAVQAELFRHVSYGIGARLVAFGSKCVVVRMFEMNCDGRIPLLVRFDSGGEAMPMMDECTLVEGVDA
jgi:hypothetical protein